MELFWFDFLIPCFPTSYQSACSLSLLLLSYYIFISFLLNLSSVPGGFAWKNYHQNPKNQLKGPKFSCNFMGPLAHRKLASMASSMRATRLMAISLGSMRVVISSSPETAKDILCGSAFVDRPIRESTRLLMFDRAIGFAPSSGNYWRHLRRIASTHMFSPKRVAGLEGLRQAVACSMIQRVEQEMAERGFVELRRVLQKGSLDNVLESVFGISGGGEFGGDLGVMVKQGYELLGEFNWADYFQLGFLDFFGVRRRCHELAGRVSEVVTQIIEQRRKDGDFKIRNDFLSALLSLPQEDLLCDADMVAVLWEMVFRGVDNIYILLEWIMARMVLHQDIQAKVRREIEIKVGHNKHVEDSDIPNLPYLQAIVKEVLRLHPPGPLLSWARLAVHDIHLDKCFIPSGTTAMVNMWAIAHDPAIWPDPWAFQPERFMELGDFSIMGSDLRLAPFGSGRRACPGKALGLATVHLWLARILQKFKWLPARPVDLGECLKLSLEMKKPLVCHAVVIS
ncbi:cytochrome P450 [Perilla frutescens var. frutescens]|nr:cytochrome P450 [Perilla frutescens var. frutescens]